MSDSSDFSQLRDKLIALAVDDCKADADLKVMREFGRRVREEEEDLGRPVFFRQAPLTGHFSYFQPTEFYLFDKLQTKDRRGSKEFEYLNASGTWVQLAKAGMQLLTSENAPRNMNEYAKYLYAVLKCINGCLEVQGARYQYFVNYLNHGPAEAKLISEVGERHSEPVLSKMMENVQDSLEDRRLQEMVKLLSKQQAEKAVRGAQGGKAPAKADASAKSK